MESAPEINNPYDYNQCGKTKEYFGFKASFVNEKEICNEIKQLKYTRDFDFLAEFFAQGSGGGGGGPNGENLPNLIQPNREYSGSGPVEKGEAWEKENYELKHGIDVLDSIWNLAVNIECPDDPTSSSWNVCSTVKNVLNVAAWAIIQTLRIVSNEENTVHGVMSVCHY